MDSLPMTPEGKEETLHNRENDKKLKRMLSIGKMNIAESAFAMMFSNQSQVNVSSNDSGVFEIVHDPDNHQEPLPARKR